MWQRCNRGPDLVELSELCVFFFFIESVSLCASVLAAVMPDHCSGGFDDQGWSLVATQLVRPPHLEVIRDPTKLLLGLATAGVTEPVAEIVYCYVLSFLLYVHPLVGNLQDGRHCWTDCQVWEAVEDLATLRWCLPVFQQVGPVGVFQPIHAEEALPMLDSTHELETTFTGGTSAGSPGLEVVGDPIEPWLRSYSSPEWSIIVRQAQT
ncbi:hypothetical protein Sjap_023138 [Stephania japonica]|uniref:Uncharacterized protein n=1 Tax=Stephania japonica TaxID=461633 RepID=A0AAP0EB23_9MAGN